MAKKVIFALFIFGGLSFVLLFLAGTKGLQFSKMAKAGASMQQPPESVSTSVVKRQVWPRLLNSIGSIEPVKGVRLDAEIPGIVSKINFQNGQEVNEGDVLLILEAMKMETQIVASKAGTVASISVKQGDAVKVGDQLVSIA